MKSADGSQLSLYRPTCLANFFSALRLRRANHKNLQLKGGPRGATGGHHHCPPPVDPQAPAARIGGLSAEARRGTLAKIRRGTPAVVLFAPLTPGARGARRS